MNEMEFSIRGPAFRDYRSRKENSLPAWSEEWHHWRMEQRTAVAHVRVCASSAAGPSAVCQDYRQTFAVRPIKK